MSKMSSKERLEQYVKEDALYQDIRNILEENERLKRQQKEFVKYLEDRIKENSKEPIDIDVILADIKRIYERDRK